MSVRANVPGQLTIEIFEMESALLIVAQTLVTLAGGELHAEERPRKVIADEVSGPHNIS